MKPSIGTGLGPFATGESSGTSLEFVGQAEDLEELESERLDLGQHAVQRGLVRDGTAQQRVPVPCLGPEAGERAQRRGAQVAADDYVVAQWSGVPAPAGHRLAAGSGARAVVVVMCPSLTPGGVSRRHTAG